jgi:hypothetical protein
LNFTGWSSLRCHDSKKIERLHVTMLVPNADCEFVLAIRRRAVTVSDRALDADRLVPLRVFDLIRRRAIDTLGDGTFKETATCLSTSTTTDFGSQPSLVREALGTIPGQNRLSGGRETLIEGVGAFPSGFASGFCVAP